MSADTLLGRLDGVRQTGTGKWTAKCPAHDDGRASLSIKETEDGRTLVHCFAGCGAADVIGAVGLQFADLFPPRETFDHDRRYSRQRPRFDALAALHAVAHEVAVIAVIASESTAPHAEDYERLLLAAIRIHAALDAVGERRQVPELQRLRRGEVAA